MNEEIKYNVVKVVKGSRKGYLTYYATDVKMTDSFEIIKEDLSREEAQEVYETGNKKLDDKLNG